MVKNNKFTHVVKKKKGMNVVSKSENKKEIDTNNTRVKYYKNRRKRMRKELKKSERIE